MYDVGSYLEYSYGEETRAPYLYNINNIHSNYISINYGDGEEYVFGGNPFVEEDEYLPGRNAFNNKNGAMLQALRFTQIRNADNSMLLLEDADTGEVLLSEELGYIEGAYYHTNMGQWQNTQHKIPLGLNLAGIPEGTRLNLSLISAPEYYCQYDAGEAIIHTDWESLAEGACLTTSFTIDNTAPGLKHVKLKDNNTLSITAKDNEYIAAVALMRGSATGYFQGPQYGYIQTIGDPVDYSYFQGFHFDGQYTYWTRFREEDNNVELILWDCEDTGRTYSLGYFGEGVWPVGGLYTDAELTGTNALTCDGLTTASIRNVELLSTVPTVELNSAKGSLNAVANTTPAVRPDSSISYDDFETIELTVTVPEAATNGIITVEYDADKLICGGAVPMADAVAYADHDNGTVTIAFADKTAIPTDGAVAVIRFLSSIAASDTTEFTITTTELNQDTAYFHEETVDAGIIHICPSDRFVDVSEDLWFHEAVDYVVSSGYMNGMDFTHFGPGATMNRAQFVTVLYRMEGEPTVNNTGIFTDVPAGQFYTDAAYWALHSGITTGTGDGTTFNPGGQLTRTELVTFMYRYCKLKGYDTTPGNLSAYRDANQVLSFAVDAWGWAVSKGIVNGMTQDTLAPMSLTNRAQAAVIFQRFDNAFLLNK